MSKNLLEKRRAYAKKKHAKSSSKFSIRILHSNGQRMFRKNFTLFRVMILAALFYDLLSEIANFAKSAVSTNSTTFSQILQRARIIKIHLEFL